MNYETITMKISILRLYKCGIVKIHEKVTKVEISKWKQVVKSLNK